MPFGRVVRAGKPRDHEADVLRRCSRACRSRPSRTIRNNCWRRCSQCAPPTNARPTAVVLTPGIYNSAYFEHTFLAQQMGVELVQGSDLVVEDGYVYMRTTHGLQRVDVIYRRIDDDFLDPTCFRADSSAGRRGLDGRVPAGTVTLANAPGTGVADDKAVYAYVPQIIKYYLDEEPILRNVPTYVCFDDQDRESRACEPRRTGRQADQRIGRLRNPDGTAGDSPSERAAYVDLIQANPRNYIAQPMLQLSTVPTLIGDELKPRHVDLRPFVLCGKEIYVDAGRIDARGTPRGIDGRQLVAGRWQQGYLGL